MAKKSNKALTKTLAAEDKAARADDRAYKIDREAMDWLSDLEDIDEKLTDWERGFVADISHRLVNKGQALTDNQRKTLQELYEKYY